MHVAAGFETECESVVCVIHVTFICVCMCGMHALDSVYG
jgi:hypothetical protein